MIVRVASCGGGKRVRIYYHCGADGLRGVKRRWYITDTN